MRQGCKKCDICRAPYETFHLCTPPERAAEILGTNHQVDRRYRDKKILETYGSGLSLSETGARFGMSAEGVRKVIIRMDGEIRDRGGNQIDKEIA